MHRRVSMADVAARAGVSAQTVSRVVNGSPRVDPATRATVEAAMTALGYRPHRAAQALRTGRTHTIGLVVSTLATVGNSRMLQTITEAAAGRDYALTVVTAPDRDDVAEAFARLQAQGIDGAIVLNEATALVRTLDVPPSLALVVVDSPPDERYAVVQTDHAAGARLATERLVEAGHETVHHLAGPTGSFAAAERERGWREALADARRDPPPLVRGDWSAESGFDAGPGLAAASAVFCANDQMALGLLRALAESGRRVPEDVGVIGFDDVPDAANYRPPLTTVRQDFAALGSAAVARLIAAIEGESPNGLVLEPSLTIRATFR